MKKFFVLMLVAVTAFCYFFYLPARFLSESSAQIVCGAYASGEVNAQSFPNAALGIPVPKLKYSGIRQITFSVPLVSQGQTVTLYVTVEPTLTFSFENARPGWRIVSVSAEHPAENGFFSSHQEGGTS